MMFQNLLLQTALDVKTSKMTSIPAFAEINPNPYYVGQRLPSETLSNKNHANRHLKELFGVIRSTIDPHLPLSKQPNQTQNSQFSVQPFTSKKSTPQTKHTKNTGVKTATQLEIRSTFFSFARPRCRSAWAFFWASASPAKVVPVPL